MDQSSEESTDSKDSAPNSHGNASSNMTKKEKRLIRRVIAKLVSKDENETAQAEEMLQEQVNEAENLEKIRIRAKSVGAGTSEGCRRSSPNKAERSKSSVRSEKKSELTVTTGKSESSKRKQGATFHMNMTDKKRDNFIRANLGLQPRYSIKENPEDRMCQDYKRNGKSRSHSREKDNQPSHKRLRAESMEYRDNKHYKDKSHADSRDVLIEIKDQSHYGKHSSDERNEFKGQGHYSDHYHAQWREETFGSQKYGRLGDERHAERRMEIPCKYFNDVGFCKYTSGHPDMFGKRRLHICDVCYNERGLKRDQSQVHCSHSKKQPTTRNDGTVVDEPCRFFNKGDCRYKSGGHASREGKYVRLHICEICFKFGEKRSHPAVECKYNESLNKHPNDSPMSKRFENKAHERYDSQEDEKPCSFFNVNGSCRYASGHNPAWGRFPKQLHICSCCLEFFGKARNHPAIDCELKKELVGERQKFVVGHPELPCNSFNSGNCVLESGHRLRSGNLRVFHICKFCFEYRGEKNNHTLEQCKLRKKLLQEVEGRSQSKYAGSRKDVRREKETGTDKSESNISKEITRKKSSNRDMEKPIENSKEGKQTTEVKPQVSQTDNLKDSGQLKTENAFKVCLIKRKTSKASTKCDSISPCGQIKHTEEAINQTVSKINEVVKQDMEFLVKEASNTEGFISVDQDIEESKQDTSIENEESKQDTSIENDEAEMDFKDENPPNTVGKNKKQESGPTDNDHRKLNDLPLLPRNKFHHNSERETNKAENGIKRRKLNDESDSADKSNHINEKEKHCDKGLLPVDDVLKSLNGEVLQRDPETKMDVNEILKKLEQLENLHTIEVENLRKARQHSKKVSGNN